MRLAQIVQHRLIALANEIRIVHPVHRVQAEITVGIDHGRLKTNMNSFVQTSCSKHLLLCLIINGQPTVDFPDKEFRRVGSIIDLEMVAAGQYQILEVDSQVKSCKLSVKSIQTHCKLVP